MSGEIILVMGPPASGKTTTVEQYTGKGYRRLNRDSFGGSSQKRGNRMHQMILELHAHGDRHFVLDNTYRNKVSREEILSLSARLGLPVHAKWLQTTAEQAQFLAARREVQKYGHVLTAEEYKQEPFKKDPNCFPPMAQFAYWKAMEPPTVEEGFASVEKVPFVMDLGPGYAWGAIIFDYDGTLRETTTGDFYPKKPDEVRLLPGRREKLFDLVRRGNLILGASNQSGIARDPGHAHYVSDENARASFERTNQLLGVDIDYAYAPERAGVPRTFKRKPQPGMGVEFIEKYRLDPARVLMVGDMKSDKTFAERCGFNFAWAKDYFV